MRLWSGANKPDERYKFHYDVFEHEGITIYILKGIKTRGKLSIWAWPKIPLFRQRYLVRGIKG